MLNKNEIPDSFAATVFVDSVKHMAEDPEDFLEAVDTILDSRMAIQVWEDSFR